MHHPLVEKEQCSNQEDHTEYCSFAFYVEVKNIAKIIIDTCVQNQVLDYTYYQEQAENHREKIHNSQTNLTFQ